MTAKWDNARAGGAGTELPAWVEQFFHGRSPRESVEVDASIECTCRDGEGLSLTTVRVCGADELDPLSFQRQTVVAYRTIANLLKKRQAQYPIRFWNFVPDINKPVSESLSRYMVFNAGRFSAFHEWYGEARAIGQYVATASGVGHTGKDLVIHCLSSSRPGVAVENPRQVSAYLYSAQYGPLPPTFARATAINLDHGDGSLLLVGGTASIRGESSLHHGDLIQQTIETLHNLAAVIRAAIDAPGDSEFNQQASDRTCLQQFRWLRVYCVRPNDRAVIAEILAEHHLNPEAIEWRHANLCRPELLVEIEGVAHLPRTVSTPQVVIPARQRAALEA